MRLITEVSIENFRSIRRMVISNLDGYCPVIGLNGTGKSNILRALNLFFNGYLDESQAPLDLERDYPDALRNARKQRRVTIAVTFDLSNSGFRPRGSDGFVEKYGITSTLCIERTWVTVQETGYLQDTISWGRSHDVMRAVDEEERLTVLSFIRAVEFRYVPNHIRPADFIRREIQPLRSSLLTRLQRTNEFRAGGVAKTMSALTRVAENMLRDTSRRVAQGTEGRGVAADVPADFVDLAFQLALQTVTANGLQPTELQGSGTQSFMLLHVLDLLDAESRARGFGWKKFSVWAIEEPESFLHAGLRSRFAHDLYSYSQAERRQVFTTTHQDEFVRVGEHAWLAALNDDQTVVNRMSARDALTQTTRMRITTFQHPLMETPDVPLVIAEGKTDAVYLGSVLANVSIRPRWRLVCLDDIDPDMRTGGDGLYAYLKNSRQVLKSRPDDAPVLVLRDWEDPKPSTDRFNSVLDVHEYSQVLQCPESLVNPDLDQTFRGIERYLDTDLIRTIVPGDILGRPTSGELPLSIRDRRRYDVLKPTLAKAVRDGAQAGKYMEDLVKWLDDVVEGILSKAPIQPFVN